MCDLSNRFCDFECCSLLFIPSCMVREILSSFVYLPLLILIDIWIYIYIISSENEGNESEDGSASSGVDEDDMTEPETESEIDSPVKVNKSSLILQIS